jgi:hypothetical protein
MGNKTTNPNVVVVRLATTAAEIKLGKCHYPGKFVRPILRAKSVEMGLLFFLDDF